MECRYLGFGNEHNLVVQSTDTVYTECEGELSPLYREKFSDPRFNPRWECGTAAYVEVVDVAASDGLNFE